MILRLILHSNNSITFSTEYRDIVIKDIKEIIGILEKLRSNDWNTDFADDFNF